MPRPRGSKRVGLDLLVDNLPDVADAKYSVGNSIVRLGTVEAFVGGQIQRFEGIDLTSRGSDLSWLEAALKLPVRSARSLLRQVPFLRDMERARDEASGLTRNGKKESWQIAPWRLNSSKPR